MDHLPADAEAIHLSRLRSEIEDSFDEAFELEYEEERLDALVEPQAGNSRFDRRAYLRELFRLQHELVRLQDWVQHKGLKIVVVFEGRDSAGKGARSNASPSGLTRASAAWQHFPRPANANAANGISSVTPRICPQRVKWCCSIGAGIIVPGSNR